MIVKIGDIVSGEFGTGKIVAITKEWIVHENEKGKEMALPISEIWIPVETTPENRGCIHDQAEIRTTP